MELTISQIIDKGEIGSVYIATDDSFDIVKTENGIMYCDDDGNTSNVLGHEGYLILSHFVINRRYKEKPRFVSFAEAVEALINGANSITCYEKEDSPKYDTYESMVDISMRMDGVETKYFWTINK